MPGHAQNGKSEPMGPFDQTEKAGFVTDAVFREKEKLNMIAVLRRTNWRISGTDGAAALLGIKPSTLAYRMKIHGVNKSDYL